jgi:hypothetical protein
MIGFLCVDFDDIFFFRNDFDDIKLKADHIDVIKIRAKQNLLDEMPCLVFRADMENSFLVLALALPIVARCLVTTQSLYVSC